MIQKSGISRTGIIVNLLFAVLCLMWTEHSTGMIALLFQSWAMLFTVIATAGFLLALFIGHKE